MKTSDFKGLVQAKSSVKFDRSIVRLGNLAFEFQTSKQARKQESKQASKQARKRCLFVNAGIRQLYSYVGVMHYALCPQSLL